MKNAVRLGDVCDENTGAFSLTVPKIDLAVMALPAATDFDCEGLSLNGRHRLLVVQGRRPLVA